MDGHYQDSSIYVGNWNWVRCFFRSNVAYVYWMVLLPIWISKARLDARVFDVYRLSGMEKRQQGISFSWGSLSLLLCLWLQSSFVKAKEFGGPINVQVRTSAKEIEYSPRGNKFYFDKQRYPTIIQWWQQSFTYGPTAVIADHISYGNNEVKSFNDLMFIAKHQLSKFEFEPYGLDVWLYTGSDDPFCYIQVTYVEQFWESFSPETYCFKHMHDNRCTYIEHEMQHIDGSHSFLSKRRILHCYGMKGKFSDIKENRSKTWSRLYSTRPLWLQTVYGEFMYYVDQQGTYHWVTPMIMVAAVAYHHETITGMIIEHYTWKKINRQQFTLATGKSLNELMDKIAYYAQNMETLNEEPTVNFIKALSVEKCKCDRIGWIKRIWSQQIVLPNTIRGRNITRLSERHTYVLPTCEFDRPGLKLGDCQVVPIEDFITSTHHDEIEVNDEKSWYKALLEDFFQMLKDFVSAIFKYVWNTLSDYLTSFGWEILAGFIIPYLSVVRLYGNIPAIFISIICTLFLYYYLDLASEELDALVG